MKIGDIVQFPHHASGEHFTMLVGHGVMTWYSYVEDKEITEECWHMTYLGPLSYTYQDKVRDRSDLFGNRIKAGETFSEAAVVVGNIYDDPSLIEKFGITPELLGV